MKLHQRRDITKGGQIIRRAVDICSYGRCAEETDTLLKLGATPANPDFDCGLCLVHWERFCEDNNSRHRSAELPEDLNYVQVEERDTTAEWEEKERVKAEETELSRATEATTISLSGTAFGAVSGDWTGLSWEKVQKGKGTSYKVTLPRREVVRFLHWAQESSEIWLVRNAERELKKMGAKT